MANNYGETRALHRRLGRGIALHGRPLPGSTFPLYEAGVSREDGTGKSSLRVSAGGRSDLAQSAPVDQPGTLVQALTSFENFRTLRATNPGYLQRCAVWSLKRALRAMPGEVMDGARHAGHVGRVYPCEVAHAQGRWLCWLGEHEMAWEAKDWRERVGKGVHKNEVN